MPKTRSKVKLLVCFFPTGPTDTLTVRFEGSADTAMAWLLRFSSPLAGRRRTATWTFVALALSLVDSLAILFSSREPISLNLSSSPQAPTDTGLLERSDRLYSLVKVLTSRASLEWCEGVYLGSTNTCPRSNKARALGAALKFLQHGRSLGHLSVCNNRGDH
jgi:hypothetical protein